MKIAIARMRRLVIGLSYILTLVALLALAPSNSYATEDGIASGTWGTCPWEISSSGTLTVHPGMGAEQESKYSGSPWGEYASDIKQIVFSAEGGDKVVAPEYSYSLFRGLVNASSVDLSGLDTSNVTNMTWMFESCSSLVSLDLSSFDTSNVTDMREMFVDCSSLVSLDLSSFDTSNITDMSSMFVDCSSLVSLDLSSFRTSKVRTMSYMFRGCGSLTSLDLSSFDTSNVTDMAGMLSGCSSLSSLDLSSLDTSSVMDMSYMFQDCGSLTSLDLSSFDTSNVTSMYLMFEGCSSLVSIDLSSFDTLSVELMSFMFRFCSSLTSLDLSSFKTSKVIAMNCMFQGCESLTSLDLSSFDTSNVADMSWMFVDCSSLASLDLSSFDTSSVDDMRGLFEACISLSSLKLGIDFAFVNGRVGSEWWRAHPWEGLPDLEETLDSDVYTGRWLGPNCEVLTSDELWSTYDGATMAGTWTWEYAEKCIANAMVSGLSEKVYTGKEIVQSLVVEVNGKTLSEGADYIVSYEDNTNVGTATVVISGIGDYVGTVEATFSILPEQVSIPSAKAGLVYSGKEQSGVVSTESFRVSGGSAINAGSYTATARLKDVKNYTWADRTTDAKSISWSIAPASITGATVSGVSDKIYTSKAVTQTPVVKTGGTTLKVGADYAVGYKNNVDVGTASMVITGIGNYTGTKTVTFNIISSGSGGSGGGAVAKQSWIRLKGATAYDTMQSIVKEGWKQTGGTVIVATGEGFADALAAAGIAGLENAPILTTTKKSLSVQTRTELNRLKPKNVIIVGGRGAVSEDVENAIKKLSFKPTVTRHKGAAAFNTANAMNKAYAGKWSDTAILATSKGYADALSAAPIAYSQHMPIFLVKDKDSLDAETIKAMKSCGIKKVMVVGGRNAVSDTVRNKLKSSGFTVDTRKGASQYDTSIEVAKWGLSLGMTADKMGVATGRGYADALAGAALCGQNNAVLVLLDKTNYKTCLPIASDYKAKITYGYVYGGRGAVPADVQSAYESASGCPKTTKW